MVKIASKEPLVAYVLLAFAVFAVLPSPKVQLKELIAAFVVAFGVLVLVNVTAGLPIQIDPVELLVNEAVGAGVLFTLTVRVELLTEVPQALFANTVNVPVPDKFPAVILITLVVELALALKFPVTDHVYDVAPVTEEML